jgi:hypothetical protein
VSSVRVFRPFLFTILVLLASQGLLETARAQGSCTPPSFNGDEESWHAAYISWCEDNGGKTGNYEDGSGQYSGWGCHPIAGKWKCGGDSSTSSSSDSSASSAGTAMGNAMATVVLDYTKALAAARAREASDRDAATAFNNNVAANDSHDAEVREDQSQADDLAKFQAQKAAATQENQNAFASAHNAAGAFLDAGLSKSNSDSSQGTPAQQKAWKQLHCLAYVSRIAFEDIALGDVTDYHDVAAESAKAFNGAAMDVSCPAAPFPDLSKSKNGSADMGAVTQKLKGDLDQASAIAQRMEQYQPKQTTLPPLPADVASDPKLASAWKMQQAINAINDAPNPGKTPEDFTQVVKDRDKLRESIGDANNAANGNFGSIQVDLSSESTAPLPIPH